MKNLVILVAFNLSLGSLLAQNIAPAPQKDKMYGYQTVGIQAGVKEAYNSARLTFGAGFRLPKNFNTGLVVGLNTLRDGFGEMGVEAIKDFNVGSQSAGSLSIVGKYLLPNDVSNRVWRSEGDTYRYTNIVLQPSYRYQFPSIKAVAVVAEIGWFFYWSEEYHKTDWSTTTENLRTSGFEFALGIGF